MNNTYLDATDEAGKAFFMEYIGKGKITMLNLLKFRDVADYSNAPALKPVDPISGEEAYQKYVDATLPELAKAGSRVLFRGKSKQFLIGPGNEEWDGVLLVEHISVERFIAFAQNETYLKNLGHRMAALEDSRLLPISETDNYK